MKAIAIAVAALSLAACQGPKQVSDMSYTEMKQLAAEITQRCIDQGAKPGTPEMDLCGQIEAKREVNSRQGAAQNRAAGLAAASQALQTTSQGYYAAARTTTARQSTNCTTRPMGAGTYTTSCY